MEHVCNYYKGIISDVTVRRIDGIVSIHCRRCGEKLEENQVDPKMLKFIKKDLENKRKNDRTRDRGSRRRT